ncbi:venom serine protease inhibitor-like [Andrena cerasifolii]|uniref:venom serine protease inhibitor-like n=1 Tax=Andrena cerasifolii TaxID=2819439 RepID=UPI004037FBED
MYRYAVLSLLLVAVAYAQKVTISPNTAPRCRINERWSECGRDCEPLCDMSTGMVWKWGTWELLTSGPGCICITDYVRNREGVCGPRSSCKT